MAHLTFHDRSLLNPVLFAMGGFDAYEPDVAKRTPVREPSFSQYSQEKALFLDVEMPGVHKDDITIELQDKRLVVIGKRFKHSLLKGINSEAQNVEQATGEDVKKSNEDEDKEMSNPSETAPKRTLANTYRAVFRLPKLIDEGAVTVDSHENGVLKLKLPHAKKPEPRKIVIQ